MEYSSAGSLRVVYCPLKNFLFSFLCLIFPHRLGSVHSYLTSWPGAGLQFLFFHLEPDLSGKFDRHFYRSVSGYISNLWGWENIEPLGLLQRVWSYLPPHAAHGHVSCLYMSFRTLAPTQMVNILSVTLMDPCSVRLNHPSFPFSLSFWLMEISFASFWNW